MASIKRLIERAEELGIPTDGRSVEEVSNDIRLYEAVQPFFYVVVFGLAMVLFVFLLEVTR